MIYIRKSIDGVLCRKNSKTLADAYNKIRYGIKKEIRGGAALNHSFFDNINIKNSVKYRMMFIAGGLAHSAFFVIFLYMGLFPLAIVNIFSILIYALGTVFGIDKHSGNMYYGWMTAFYLEIVVHSVIATLLIGVETSFQLYSLVVLPLSIYVLFFSCKVERFFATMTVFTVVCVLSLVVSTLMTVNSDVFPLYPLSYTDIHMLRSVNMVFSGILLVFFSMLFALEIYGLLRRLNEKNEELKYTATHDALTGLFNRHSLKPLFEELCASGEYYCVALGDIDDFKKVNDTYGHDCGDAVLREVADIIAEGITDGDTACRWGGEEILVILHGSREDCLWRMQAIHNKIGACAVKHNQKKIGVTMTFGFAESDGRDIEELISCADDRLYCGKKSGKNKIVCTD